MMELNEKQELVFQWIYICLSAYKEGFKASYRSLIRLDGCHVKRPIPRQILITFRIDPNNQIFLVAYVIVETESKDC